MVNYLAYHSLKDVYLDIDRNK